MNSKTQTPSLVSLTENEQHDGLELRFPGNPGEAVTTTMKREGWRYLGPKHGGPLWYHKRGPSAKSFAERLATLLNRKAQPGPEPKPAVMVPIGMVNVTFPKPVAPVSVPVSIGSFS